MIIIDATDLIVGRLATYAAKQALLGEEVRIINSEKAVISGKRENTLDEFFARKARGTHAKGPFLLRMPERILRRSVRGMLPFKKTRGRVAYRKVLCYMGVPEEFKDKKPITVAEANKSKLPDLRFITLLEISKRVGAKLD